MSGSNGASPPSGHASAAAFSHAVLLYESVDEYARTVTPFIEEGAAAGDTIVVAAGTQHHDAVRSMVSTETAARILYVEDTPDAGTPAQRLTSLQRLLADVGSTGTPVRVVGAVPGELVEAGHLDAHFRTDAAFNRVCPVSAAKVVCGYDLTVIPDDAIDSLLRNHPEVLEVAGTRPNPSFVEPESILRDFYRRPLAPPGAGVFELAEPRDAAAARAFVHDALNGAGVGAPRLDEFLVAINEVATNALRYGARPTVRVWRETSGRAVCEVADHGPGIPDAFAGFRLPDIDQVGGWGLWLAYQLADGVDVRTCSHGTTVRLHLEAGAAPEAT